MAIRINLYWGIYFANMCSRARHRQFRLHMSRQLPFGALLAVAEELTHRSGKTFDELSDSVDLKASTVQNIVHDLVMFRVAQESGSHALLDSEIPSSDRDAILDRIRTVLKRHALYLALSSSDKGSEFRLDDLITYLQRTNPTAHHRTHTWKVYAERIAQWLCVAGLLEAVPNGWVLRDCGKPMPPSAARRHKTRGRSHRRAFQAEAPPERVIACLDWIGETSERTRSEVKKAGYRNALGVLVRFGLVQLNAYGAYVISEMRSTEVSASLVWKNAWCDPTLRQIRDWLSSQPSMSGRQIGERLAQMNGETWSSTSTIRIGNGLRRWARWMIEGEKSASPPAIPKRGRASGSSAQASLFDE